MTLPVRTGARNTIGAEDGPAPVPEEVPGCRELLARLAAESAGPRAAGKIAFVGVGEHDVYNITAPFFFDGQTLIAGRVESRFTESSTLVLFRRGRDGTWHPCPGAPVLPGLQDPCVTTINGELILGGVRFPVPLPDGRNGWRMEFYRGRRLSGLERFLTGPDHMKDIRLICLPDGRVAVFNRPQGEVGGRGKIGLTLARSLDELSAKVIVEAPLLEAQHPDSEWSGANEIHVLRDGRLGVLGHIACWDEQETRHYYPMVFAVHPDTRRASALRIIARRCDFPEGPAKRPDLADVLFSGGLLRHGNGTATLFAGLSDAEAGYLRMDDPMAPFEP